jgi:hypothetical protein
LLGALKLHALARDGNPRAFLAGLRAEVPAADPVLLTSADGADRIASALWLPRASAASVADLVLLGADPANDLPALVRRHLHQHFAEDRRVFLTLEGETALRHRPSYDRHPAVAALLQTLLEDFTVVQRDRGAFRAKELLPKKAR